MRLRRHRPSFFLLIAVLAVISLTACGGGGGSTVVTPPPPAPNFTSTPVTAAVEGAAYSYQLGATDPAGGAVTYSLTSAPAGATLSGSTIAWTPTAAQSRVSNQFTVTARTAAGGTASQSWAVSPNGTIHVSWIDTRWGPNGSADVPFDWSNVGLLAAALVPQPDGTYLPLYGSGGADGKFQIPNVPAGYYWLRISPRYLYWTNSSTFDFGADLMGSQSIGTGPLTATIFNFTFTGVEQTQTPSWIQFVTPESGFFSYFGSTLIGSSTFNGTMVLGSNFDFSKLKRAFVLQHKPVPLGPVAGYVLGPELTITDLSLTNGAPNTVSGTLAPSPQSTIALNIKGSDWATLFDHVGPGTATPAGTHFSVFVEPYVVNRYAIPGSTLSLVSPAPVGSPTWNLLRPLWLSTCTGTLTSSPLIVAPPVLMTDQNLGTVQYGDPFPATWERAFSICQQATVQVPVPGQSTPNTFIATNGAITSLPTAPVGPLISAVQNPTLNGGSLFTAATLDTTTATLSWSRPALGSVTGYSVQVETPVTFMDGSSQYVQTAIIGTAKTTMTLPPGILLPGHSYVFVITALSDARASMETSPHRSALPIANANVISAPFTISTTAPTAGTTDTGQ